MLSDVLWYLSWLGVAFAASIEQAWRGQAVPYVAEAFSALSGAAALFQLPVPWAAVVGVLVYGVLRGRAGAHLLFTRRPLPVLAVALFALCVVRLVSLPLTAALPVYLGAILLVGTTPGGLGLTLSQAWLPIALSLALLPRTRMFWALGMVLASLLVWGVGGAHVPRLPWLVGVKFGVFVVVVGVFRPYAVEPVSSGSGGRGLPACTLKLGDLVSTDAENTPCVLNGNPCPLNFNGSLDLVCGGARRGRCVALDGAQNVCHCLPGYCGTASEVRFLPRKNRYFAFGCTDRAVACVNGSAPLDEPADTDSLRWMRPSNRCECICDRDDVVGPACNLTCPTSAAGVICNGFPCVSNRNGTAAECVCDSTASGRGCESYNCNGNGELVDGLCRCEPGFYPPGANGSAAVCNSTCDDAPCSGHGSCVSATTCVCDLGWEATSNCSTCDPGLTTACGPVGACDGRKCTCPDDLDPTTLCATCLDPRRDPARKCASCLRGYYFDAAAQRCAPCSSECAFVGCTSATRCLCPANFSGPNCECDDLACANTGGKCQPDTGVCECGDRCLRDDNVCGEPCASQTPCAQSTSAACCDGLSGACRCPAAAQSASTSCTASIQLQFGH